MPPARLPPTPESSVELIGKPTPDTFSPNSSFSLPPPALSNDAGLQAGSSIIATQSKSTLYRPLSPASPPMRGEQSSSSSNGRDSVRSEISLPPPPTRSRRIIQMKPKSQIIESPKLAPAPGKQSSKASVSQSPPAAKKGKGRQGTAAGRKTARKTAHSLIERRRRAKMNEEFGVLKQMVPACRDQDLHKLSILQGSIEYLQYLETCVSELQNGSRRSIASAERSNEPTQAQHNATRSSHTSHSGIKRSLDTMTSQDELMLDQGSSSTQATRFDCRRDSSSSSLLLGSPFLTGSAPLPPLENTSPTTISGGERKSKHAIDEGLQQPRVGAERDVDREATEALLLLNSDRRSCRSQGISVQDLLSS
ncbi:MAG: hypothetical protein M1825_003039 [Sarcosagium campestre]|nr:MAG: hypothetical protein M1825_003039 [Sarcosagium campestre]